MGGFVYISIKVVITAYQAQPEDAPAASSQGELTGKHPCSLQ